MIYLMAGPMAIAARHEWLPILSKAIADADGRWSEDQLLADVLDGRVLIWVVSQQDRTKGVFTTRVIESRVSWVLVEDCAGDDLHEWMPEALHALETWARELGAAQIVFEGRRGWERLLRGYGFETTRIQGVKTLRTLQ